jgi:DNA-binding SARP family transcriptional activator
VVRLALLGGAALTTKEGASIPRLERKTAGVLAYLALEGVQSRSRCAGLLWPDTPERAARNNLVQALRRVQRDAKRSFVDGDDALRLDGAEVDVADLELSVMRGRYADAARLGGELLAGYDFDDCPDFADWLAWRRRMVTTTLRRALEEECDRLAKERDYPAAIRLAELVVARDPHSEHGHRRLVMLHHERGDAAAALDAYVQYERMLRRHELRPSPDAIALRDLVKRGSTRRARVDPELPLRLARPPFVARRRVHDRAERALAAGRAVMLFGERGVGKTRSMIELAASKGAYELVEARAGDAGVVYATIARALARLVERRRPDLPDWVRAELARIAPGAEASETDDVTLLEAIAEVVARSGDKGMRVLAIDDLHLADDASLAAIAHLVRRPGPLVVLASRSRDILADVARVDVPPMTDAEVRALVAAVKAGPALRGVDIEKLGNNPLLVLDAVKAALEGRALSTSPCEVRALVERRIDDLSPAAARLARIAAIAGGEIDVDIAARMLETQPVDLTDAWAELERAQVWDGAAGRFAHDALAELLEGAMPLPIRQHLHHRVAELLAERSADPTRIARHFSAAGRGDLAAPHVLAAAERAYALSRQADAVRLWEEAATLFERAGKLDAAHAALVAGGRRARHVDSAVTMPRMLASLERVERTDRERCRTLVVRAWYEEGHESAEATARRALGAAIAHGDVLMEAESRQVIFLTQNRRGDPEAGASLAAFREAADRLGDNEAIIAGILHEAELEAIHGRHARAVEVFLEAYDRLAKWGRHKNHLAGFLGMAATSEIARGHGKRAEALLARADVHVAEVHSLGLVVHPRVTIPRAACHLVFGRLARALEDARAQLEAEARPTWRGNLRVLLVRIAARACDDALADRVLDAQLGDPSATPRDRAAAIIARADAAVGMHPFPSRAHAKLVETYGSPLDRIALALLRRDETHAKRALDEATALGADGHALLSRCVLGEIALAKNDARRALDLADECVAALGEIAGLEVYPPRILALRAHALTRLGDRRAKAALAAARKSVETTGAGLPRRVVVQHTKHFQLIAR